MKSRKKAAAAISLAAIMMCGAFAGCKLISTDASKDMKQVIADVDISTSADFAAGAEFAAYKNTVEKSEINKRDLVASFISNYSSFTSYMQSGSGSYKFIFDTLSKSLVERQIYLQYAKVYFLKNGSWEEEAEERTTYSLQEYEALQKKEFDSKNERDIELLGFFLTQEERDRTDYNLRVTFNNTIDSAEKKYIKNEDDEHDHESDVRTLPTGVGSTNSDYFDNAYRIYTASGDMENAYPHGSYERVEGSTVTSRRKAYDNFLSNLRRNDLLEKGENTNNIEKLSYYAMEKKTAYEDALIQKLNKTFIAEEVPKITEEWCNEQFANTLGNQTNNFTNNSAALKSALDSVSDSSFVLTSAGADFGFVINILLPFSTKQSEELSDAAQDYKDVKGNKFATRARLLQNVKATDQRGTWFTGETDYSFKFTEDDNAYTGGNDKRTYLFFEDELQEGTNKVEQIKNYVGHYSYNGIYDEDKRVYEPNPVTIDGFIAEMEGYLNHVLGSGSATGAPVFTDAEDYYGQTNYYKDNGTADYSKFLYYQGKVNFDAFDANKVFAKDSKENLAMSVINELSFAYNTDTAGLNSYLGYVVSADKTDFVPEFEYAAQLAVQGGAGTYTVAPSDYGWHIMYCTFSYKDNATPYTFNYADRYEEGTFSNLYFESLKPEAVNTNASNRRTKIINSYQDCYTQYENRYSDLTNIG